MVNPLSHRFKLESTNQIFRLGGFSFKFPKFPKLGRFGKIGNKIGKIKGPDGKITGLRSVKVTAEIMEQSFVLASKGIKVGDVVTYDEQREVWWPKQKCEHWCLNNQRLLEVDVKTRIVVAPCSPCSMDSRG